MNITRAIPGAGLLLVITLTFSCSSKIPPTDWEQITSPQYKADDYSNVVNRWTRHATQLKDLDTALDVTVTPWTPDFQSGYAVYAQDVYRLSDGDLAKVRQENLVKWNKELHFMMAATSSNMNWNDFDSHNSIWHLRLVNDAGEEVAPLYINRENSVKPHITNFFPYIEKFHRVYYVVFPANLPDGRALLSKQTQKFTLRYSGPLGHVDLEWHR